MLGVTFSSVLFLVSCQQEEEAKAEEPAETCEDHGGTCGYIFEVGTNGLVMGPSGLCDEENIYEAACVVPEEVCGGATDMICCDEESSFSSSPACTYGEYACSDGFSLVEPSDPSCP